MKPIELRSEELQEVMGSVPPWIVRWGITVLAVIVVLILAGSFLFKYPDTITASITLSDYNPPAHIVVKQNGRIHRLWVKDGESVSEGHYLGMIENPASAEDIRSVLLLAEQVLKRSDSLPAIETADLRLGSVQSAYTQFVRSYTDLFTFRQLGFYPKKIAALENQLEGYHRYYRKQDEQVRLAVSQHRVVRERFENDSLLYRRGVIAQVEFEEAQNRYLNSQSTLLQTSGALDNLSVQIGQMESSVLDTRLQQSEKESVLERDLRNSAELLLNEIHTWEQNYILKSSIAGRVSFTSVWSENQNVKAGDEVFVVLPDTTTRLLGKATLPTVRAGKVKRGQRVIVRFNNFPDQEFGVVEGRVEQIAPVPIEDNYRIEVSFPHGLKTSYGTELPLYPEMLGTADIVTEELRVIERFFQPLKKLIKNNL